MSSTVSLVSVLHVTPRFPSFSLNLVPYRRGGSSGTRIDGGRGATGAVRDSDRESLTGIGGSY